ncbi:MAG: hypothetical protein U0P30_11685 [Vicinamibacterales bacterium]
MRTFAAGMAGLVLVLSSTIHAVTVLPATLEELVQESVTVVHGRVTGVDAHWTADRRTIESTVTLDVTDTLKGAVTETASFVVPGGEAGGRILVMPGAPVFRPGDDVIVFLRGRAPALPQPVGLSLGVFRVAVDARGVAQVVPSAISTAGARGTVARGAATREVRSLDAFRADVRKAGARR